MSIRELITSGDLSVAESIQYSERLRRAFEEVWRRYQAEAGPAWHARRTGLYAKINGQTLNRKLNGAAETRARKVIGKLVEESGCAPSTAREITHALGIDWLHARNTANLTLAISD